MISKVGFDTWLTSPGTKKTVVGFRPKILFVFTQPNTANSDMVPSFSQYFGVATTDEDGNVPTKQICRIMYEPNGDTLGENQVSYIDTAILTMADNGGVFAQASLVSFDSDGFTIDYTTCPVSAYRFAYLAIGGNEIQSSYLGKLTVADVNATVTVNTIPFDPEWVMFLTSWYKPGDSDSGLGIRASFGAPRASRTNFNPVNPIGNYPSHFEQATRNVSNGGVVCRNQVAITDGAFGNATSSGFPRIKLLDYITNGFTMEVVKSTPGTFGNREIFYIALKTQNAEMSSVYGGSFTGLTNPTSVDIPSTNVRNPNCVIIDEFQGNPDGQSPSMSTSFINTGISFIDQDGNVASTQAMISPVANTTMPNPNPATINYHAIHDDALLVAYTHRDGTYYRHCTFDSWESGETDGTLHLAHHVTTPYLTSIMNLYFFGSVSEQIVGQIGVIN